MLAELTPTKPHCEAMEVFGDVDDDYNQHDIQLGNNFPHVDRVIWEVASHIEGNFGPPYDAILVYSEAHNGTLYIFTPKSHHWWNNDIRSMLSNYLMGLRSLLDLLR